MSLHITLSDNFPNKHGKHWWNIFLEDNSFISEWFLHFQLNSSLAPGATELGIIDLQRSAKKLVSGCEKVLPALAELLYLALPGSCSEGVTVHSVWSCSSPDTQIIKKPSSPGTFCSQLKFFRTISIEHHVRNRIWPESWADCHTVVIHKPQIFSIHK